MKDFFELFTSLINGFLSGSINPAAFKKDYMRLWRECRDAGELEPLNASVKQAFDRIFTASDSYCEDPSLRGSEDLDEQQFLDQVTVIARDMHHQVDVE